ncbi:MAG: GHMP kinase [Candidatus Saganbacteria bacterium]|nr:GHMP kinase [Candidatus Saganbacteria bacterium]
MSIKRTGILVSHSGYAVHNRLADAEKRGKLPSVTGFHRIDGPGSGLNMPLVQRTYFSFREVPGRLDRDPSWKWSKGLPRTVDFTINTGTKITAYPFKPGKLAIESMDYPDLRHVEGKTGQIPPVKRNWLLKIMETFGLNGVMMTIENTDERTMSGGLGGSATVSTSVAILAAHLAGIALSKAQTVSLASVYENDLGVSLTGTQEQWNVVRGGIADHVWFPFGRPGLGTGYGDAVVRTLLQPAQYGDVRPHMALIHSGRMHASKAVNREWLRKIKTAAGYRDYAGLLPLAYDFAEAVRTRDWGKASELIEKYRAIRTTLCREYMSGSEWLYEIASRNKTVIFPLGAGGGGVCLNFGETPGAVESTVAEVRAIDPGRIIDFDLREKGHILENVS